ncbi:MAG: D-alanine--D-alanine ligase [Ignavibacteriales bacterium]|nr:D-alanine--D-alanine ligase [Ignavibacteriales bacterium]
MKSKVKNQIRLRRTKIRVGVIFGGRSAEHEVSLVSATSIINALDKNKYEIIQIGITKDNVWYSGDNVLERIKNKGYFNSDDSCYISPTSHTNAGLCVDGPKRPLTRFDVDVVFPVLHGMFGEDGTIQGLLELSGIPYVGAGVLGSAVGMDKVITKQLCENAGIPVAPYIWFLESEYKKNPKTIINLIEKKIKYPCFVKPANSGSSVGISKSKNRKSLVDAIKLALKHDRKILIEKSIENAMEIEISVLGNDEPTASVPGEIISSNEFYDYDAKYVDGKSQSIIPAKLPKEIANKIKEYALLGFRSIDCAGMARADFLVTKNNYKIYFNEINTIPGFTSISMYPKLWEASGLSYSKLLDKLIQLGLDRAKRNVKKDVHFTPMKEWHRK